MLKYADQLTSLPTMSPKARNAVIRGAPKQFIAALVDCAKTLIKGYASMDARQLNAVRRRENHFRKLLNRKTSVPQKKRILQSGGFLPALLGPLFKIGAPLITNLLGGLLGGGSRR